MASTTAKALPWYKSGKGLSTAGLAVIFAIAVYISGKHIIHVAQHYGQSADVAYPLPVIIDLFALFCAIRRRSATSGIQRKMTATGMWGMLITSLWFNIESALISNVTLSGVDLGKALFIGALAAIVVAGAAEILTHVRKSPSSTTKPKAPSKPATASTPSKVTTPRQRKPIKSETISDPIAA